MNRSDTLTKIAPALVKALAKIEGVAKTKANPGFKGAKYATLESVIDASKEHLTECGLTVLQLPGPLVDGVLTLETVILHESGEFISGDFGIALGKQDPQGVGSAISYARRYALMAALNMPAVDDDAEAAHGRQWAANGHSEPIQSRDLSVHPDGKDFWKCEGPGMTAHYAKKEGFADLHEKMREQIRDLHTDAQRREWIDVNLPDIQKMPKSWRVILRSDIEEQAQPVAA